MAAESKVRTRERWEEEFQAGKWDFLKKDEEQERLRIVCRLIADALEAQERFCLIDLGSGEGLLAHHMDAHLNATRQNEMAQYIAMDIAQPALDGIKPPAAPTLKVRASLREFSPLVSLPDSNELKSARPVIVANEVLTYDEDSVEQLARIAGEVRSLSNQLPLIVVSCVGPHPDKPNWTAASEKLWAELAGKNWPRIAFEEVRDEASGVKWDLGVFRFQAE